MWTCPCGRKYHYSYIEVGKMEVLFWKPITVCILVQEKCQSQRTDIYQ